MPACGRCGTLSHSGTMMRGRGFSRLCGTRGTPVCHAGLSWREQDARRNAGEPFDDDPDPEAQLLQQDTVARVREAIGELPVEFREVIVLREMEGLSYKEIATVVRVPIGTVMSRLSRARERLLADLQAAADLEALP